MTTARNAALDAWIDSHFDEEVRFLQELVRVPTDTPPGNNTPHAERTAELLKVFGFEAERHAIPEAAVKAAGLETITNLVVRRRYGAGRTVGMNAHGDVVPPGEGWSHDPYGGEVVGGKLYGRAAAVSKCDFATFTFATRALESLGLPLKGTVEKASAHYYSGDELGFPHPGNRLEAACYTKSCHDHVHSFERCNLDDLHLAYLMKVKPLQL
jgi:acetylornithine deacetylase/succinyl-diaminopimelate desuccinylase-like protein